MQYMEPLTRSEQISSRHPKPRRSGHSRPLQWPKSKVRKAPKLCNWTRRTAKVEW